MQPVEDGGVRFAPDNGVNHVWSGLGGIERSRAAVRMCWLARPQNQMYIIPSWLHLCT